MTTSERTVFTVVTESEDFRPYRFTFHRARFGAFPKLTKVERQQTNGRDTFWTQHRVSCHGALPGIIQQEIEFAKDSVRRAR
jgi:hypothetical protein